MKYDISVALLCYNPDIIKLKRTIVSIIKQTNILFELIIADDGSKDKEYIEEIKNYLIEKQFNDYKIVSNIENQGTVKNLMSAVEAAEGKYIKDISPGDYLYDENTLNLFIQEVKNRKSKICFGKALYYSYNNGQIKLYGRQNPNVIEVYKKRNASKIRRNYFFFQDYILGASLCFEKEILLHNLDKLKRYVTYSEDLVVLLFLQNNIKVDYIDMPIIWYEYGTGISTEKSKRWQEIIYKEQKSVYKHLLHEQKSAYNFLFGYEGNRWIKLFRKCLKKPAFLMFFIRTTFPEFFHNELKKYSKQKLENILQEVYSDE